MEQPNELKVGIDPDKITHFIRGYPTNNLDLFFGLIDLGLKPAHQRTYDLLRGKFNLGKLLLDRFDFGFYLKQNCATD